MFNFAWLNHALNSMPSSPKIVFMGTPVFAAAQLHALMRAQYDVAAVVTSPDMPAGRGLQVKPSAVKECAMQYGIPILQPENLRDAAFLAQLRSFAADIFVVAAFRMLPEEVWTMPPLGAFNLHASLLPQYRGAAPINWAIINGETQSGITTFLLDKNMDTGQILLQQPVSIMPEDNAGMLHDKLMNMGGSIIMQTINGLAAKTIVPQPQSIQAELKPAPKLYKHNTRLNPLLDVNSAANFVRGLSPYPAAWVEVQAADGIPQILKIYDAQAVVDSCTTRAGSMIQRDGMLLLRCRNGYLNVRELQLQGRKRMSASEFLRGLRTEMVLLPTP
jgi:methionyl-tRNA formyltransferase